MSNSKLELNVDYSVFNMKYLVNSKYLINEYLTAFIIRKYY